MEGLAACFEELGDPRSGNAGLHDLAEISNYPPPFPAR
jgi:hypothetical protein